MRMPFVGSAYGGVVRSAVTRTQGTQEAQWTHRDQLAAGRWQLAAGSAHNAKR